MASKARFISKFTVYSDNIFNGTIEPADLGTIYTGNITESTANLYFTNARSRAAVSNVDGVSYVEATGVISLTNTGVGSGNYGNSSYVPSITVDSQGRITSAANVQFSLPTTGVVAATYGNSTYYPTITVTTSGVVTSASNVLLTTTNIVEGSQQYFTTARFQANLAGQSQNVIPSSANTYDLGSGSLRFENIYFDGIVFGGNLNGNVNVLDYAQTGSFRVGYRTMPQNNQGAGGSYTLVRSDDGKHIYLTGGTTHTLTVPTNAVVPFEIGAVISVINDNSGALTISSSGTLQLANGATGSRTVATKGVATLIKVATDTWYVFGLGVT